MSGTYPSTPCPDRVTLVKAIPTDISFTHSGRRKVRWRGYHRWRAEIEYNILTREEAAPLFAFIASQRGRMGVFDVVIPGHDTPRGPAGGTPLVVGAVAVGATSVPFDGATTSTTGWLKGGDLVSFAGHAKVYMVTADANTDSGGAGTLTVEPPLISSVADNEAVTVSGVTFRMALDGDELPMSQSGPRFERLRVLMLEAPYE